MSNDPILVIGATGLQSGAAHGGLKPHLIGKIKALGPQS